METKFIHLFLFSKKVFKRIKGVKVNQNSETERKLIDEPASHLLIRVTLLTLQTLLTLPGR